MSTLKLSDLEILEKFKDGASPPPTMATTIPMRITEVKKGFIEFGAVANDMHLNPMAAFTEVLQQRYSILQQDLPYIPCYCLAKVMELST